MANFGVIGTGSMGKNHARVYSELPDITFVGIYDKNEELGKNIASRLNTTYFDSLDSILKNVDGVSIATPTFTHYEVAKQALEQGKHVLLEKPICSNLKEARSLYEIAKDNGLTLAVGHIERYNPATSFAKNYLNKHKLDILNMSARRVGGFSGTIHDVGVIMDLGIHDIDNLRYLANSEVESVYARTIKHDGNLDNPFENHANISLKFKNGILGTIETNWLLSRKERVINLVCSNRYDLKLDYIAKNVSIGEGELRNFDDLNMSQIAWDEKNTIKHLQGQEPLKLEIKDFINAINNKSTPFVSAEDGIAALEIATAAEQSSKTNKVVSL